MMERKSRIANIVKKAIENNPPSPQIDSNKSNPNNAQGNPHLGPSKSRQELPL